MSGQLSKPYPKWPAGLTDVLLFVLSTLSEVATLQSTLHLSCRARETAAAASFHVFEGIREAKSAQCSIQSVPSSTKRRCFSRPTCRQPTKWRDRGKRSAIFRFQLRCPEGYGWGRDHFWRMKSPHFEDSSMRIRLIVSKNNSRWDIPLSFHSFVNAEWVSKVRARISTSPSQSRSWGTGSI